MAILLGISGQAGVGKTTASNVFVNNYNFVEISFADPIKRAAMDWWDFSEDQLWGPSEMRNKPDERYYIKHSGEYLTPRSALQQIGDGVRQADPDVWLRYAINDANQIIENPLSWSYHRTRGLYNEKRDSKLNGVVFGDCRYPNEMERVKDAGGVLIRIKRPTTLTGAASEHPSEKEQLAVPDDFFDFVVDNNDSLEYFISAVDFIAAEFQNNDFKFKQLCFNWI